jgi:hypothetical protein
MLVWRSILIGIVPTGLLFLAFLLWAALGQYERGIVNPDLTVLTRQVFHNPYFWVSAVAVFFAAHVVTNR